MTVAVALSLGLVGCAVSPVSVTTPTSAPTSSTTVSIPTVSPSTATPSASPTTASPTPKATTSSAKPASKATTRTSKPFTVNGIVLVNKRHRLTSAYVPAWASSQPNGLSAETNAALTKLIADARKRGVTLRVRSAYRSYATQASSYSRAVATYGTKKANQFFAQPGASEHQTGLSLDLTDAAGRRGYAFRGTPAANYIAAHADDFGFIVRYPQGKESITGYEWEPWHVRYVGTKVAAAIAKKPGMTLEEYLGQA